MFFAPHILYVKDTELSRDAYGRPIKTTESWREVCRCRLDENTIQEFTTDDGKVFRPTYHIVCSGNIDVKPKQEVRVMNRDKLRGEGIVYNVKHLNVLDYSEIWV